MFVACFVLVVVLNLLGGVKQLLKIGPEEFWKDLVKTRVISAYNTELRSDACVRWQFLFRLIAVEVQVNNGVAPVTGLDSVNVIEN